MPRSSSPRLPSLEHLLRGRGRRRWTYTALTLVVALLLMLADRSGLLLKAGDDVSRYDGKWFKVVRVVDGDTLEIDVPDGDEPYTRVRLWGVDTPEKARHDPPAPAEPYAEEATDLARHFAEGRQVRLTLEPHRLRGHYGRLLAFVELQDGTMLNEVLVFSGLARADDRWSHRYLQRFEALQQEAQQAGRGMWETPSR